MLTGNGDRGSFEFARHGTVKRHMVQAGMAFFLLWVIYGTAQPCRAAEVVDEVHNLTRDLEEEAPRPREEESRFVPVPIPIGNPTIGAGLAVAGLYMHPQQEGDTVSPTTISGLLGLYTSTESWAVGAFHEGFYSQDRYRVRGALAYGEFNLKFYGIGNDSPFREDPLQYSAKTTVFMPRLLFRLPLENWFLGARYLFVNADIAFDLTGGPPGVPEANATTRTAGLGLVAVYDSRDNKLWPSSGSWFELTGTDYGEYFGGEFDYGKLIVKFAQYIPLSKPVTLAYRLDGQFVNGDAPFYDLARLHLRGFPSGRYLDNEAVTAQAEIRWNVYGRWIGLLFGGAGRIAQEFSQLDDSPTQYAGGVGARYIITKKRKLSVGLDVAFGDDEVILYVMVGDWLAN